MRLEDLPALFSVGDGVFFDIGANIGHVAIPLCRKYPNLRVVAFEAVPEIFSALSINIRNANASNCFAVNRIVSERSGFSKISYSLKSPFLGAGTIVDDLANEARLGKNFLCATVESETLDSFCHRMKVYPDIIKIDVEGAESHVVKGGFQVISKVVPVIYAECGFGISKSMDQIRLSYLNLLEELGYRLYLVDLSMINGVWLKRPWESLKFRCRVHAVDLSSHKNGECTCLGNLLCVPQNFKDLYEQGRQVCELNELLRFLQTEWI